MATLSDKERVLCVDIDQTLIKTDLLFESLCALGRNSPLKLLLLPFWVLRGRAFLKSKLALHSRLDASRLPYNKELLEFLRAAHAGGRKIVACSASDHLLVARLVAHLGFFSQIFASDGKLNLKGKRKAELLVRNFGEKQFDYAGDSWADVAVWRKCAMPIIVTGNPFRLRVLRKEFPNALYFPGVESTLNSILRALRVHQWLKNLLLFLPVLAGHKWFETDILQKSAVGFFSFSVCASSVYILNDLLDLQSDREHPKKCSRPLANGDLSIQTALLLFPLLFLLSLILALQLTPKFVMALLIYWCLTCAYSFYFKRQVLFDVIILASLYTLRVLAGAYATGIKVSEWLLLFSMFMFFSLACIKRVSELVRLIGSGKESPSGRGYMLSDLSQISQFGSASGFISVLVMALYIGSPETALLYSHPQFLWLICPMLMFWVGRIWLLAQRAQLDEDPVVFAMSDRMSYLVGLACLVFALFAI